MVRVLCPALGLFTGPEKGFFGIEHRQHPINGWFAFRENAEFYIEFDQRIGHQPICQKWIFKKYSFIDNLQTQFPPQIEIDEDDLIRKEDLSKHEYYKEQPGYTGIYKDDP